MKKKVINLYRYSELSDKAKARAYRDWKEADPPDLHWIEKEVMENLDVMGFSSIYLYSDIGGMAESFSFDGRWGSPMKERDKLTNINYQEAYDLLKAWEDRDLELKMTVTSYQNLIEIGVLDDYNSVTIEKMNAVEASLRKLAAVIREQMSEAFEVDSSEETFIAQSENSWFLESGEFEEYD